MAKVVALRPLEVKVDADAVVTELTGAMMRPVLAMAETLQARLESEGLPAWRCLRITVHLSEQLRTALAADGAFDLVVTQDNTV